jgi:hypothetical protein
MDWSKRGAVALSLALGAVILVGGRSAGAQVLPSSDATAGYLVFPKVVVNTGAAGGNQTDTFIQLTNTSLAGLRVVHCFYIDGTDWVPDDFTLELTPGQPVGWSVREGVTTVPAPGTEIGRASCRERVCLQV